MKKFHTNLLLATVLMQLLANAPAHADDNGVVRMNSSGDIIDVTGKVIAVPNSNDARNDDLKKYYTNLDATGRSTGKSDFYIVSDPDKGFVEKAADPAAVTAVSTTAPTIPNFDFTPFKNTATTTTIPTTTSGTLTTTGSINTASAMTNNMASSYSTRNSGVVIRNGIRMPATTTSGMANGIANGTLTNGMNSQNSTNKQSPQTLSGTPISKPAMVDAPTSDGPSDSVYGNMNNAQTLYGH